MSRDGVQGTFGDVKRLNVALGQSVLQNFNLQVVSVTGDTVALKYDGIAGNAPEIYNNFVALWQGPIVNLNIPPLRRQNILGNVQPGSFVMDQLSIGLSSYTVAYGVGKELTTICATQMINAGGSPGHCENVSIGLDFVGANCISVSYKVLAGYLPCTYGNWIGLWEGNALPYSSGDPIAKVAISDNGTQGCVGINNVTLKIKTEYTLVYFTGNEMTEAAALLNFNTGDYA